MKAPGLTITQTEKGVWVSINPTDEQPIDSADQSATQAEPETEKLPGQTMILIHGRGAQPSQTHLLAHWRTALERGLVRDFPKGLDLSNTRVQLVYYGDLLNEIRAGEGVNTAMDLADRENALKSLVARKNSKQFRRVHYEALPGKSSFKEFRADLGAPLSSVFGLGEKRIRRVMPELHEYWQNTSGFQDSVHERLEEHLNAALERGDRTMVVSHCLGTVIAYDTFWKMSRDEDKDRKDHRVDSWVTLGSPLADNYVRHHLAGGKTSTGSSKNVSYPDLVNNWLNVAAEDDYVCHDETVANDFQAMLDKRLISRIEDYRIYNLTERYGKSNPHGALGYLIHPRMSRILQDWLKASPGT
jgi:hypothetical protein